MRLSLRYRLLLPLVIVLLAEILGTAWFAWMAAESAEQRVMTQLQAVARTLTEPPTFPLTGRVLEQMRGLTGAEFVLVRADGSRLATFPADQNLSELVMITFADGLKKSGEFSPSIPFHGQAYRILTMNLPPNHPNAGGTLLVCFPEARRRSLLWDAARPLLLLGAAGAGLAGLLLGATAQRLLRSIRDLQLRSRAIADGNFAPVTVPPGNDEITDLYRAIQEMAQRLADFEAAMRASERLRILGQFSGGLAHQLRNIAAGARLALQLHADETPAADRETLDVALRQLRRLEQIVQQYLHLGKPPSERRETCDLRRIIIPVVELLQPQASHAEIILDWKMPTEPAIISADPIELGHLVHNLVGNAIEAAGHGGRVEIHLTRLTGGWRLEVSDTGPGPPAAIAETLFEPFVTGREQGIGLGLAVARQIAEAYHGRVFWERRGVQTVFTAELPAESAQERPGRA